MKAALAAVMLCAAAPVWAEGLLVRNVTFACDRQVEVPVVFVTGAAESVAVFQIEGRQILLYQERAASGARYAWPSDGAGYVLWAKGDTATILWREAGVETPILSCSAQM